ncbi:spore germination protein [Paenibacillus herberti]|uniref:Spore germination protein n=1 Tax=Paenibacillus herberti TaxID=1619309 RepID=A0A229P2U9_9BACL|nr:spore germination protein [Paenibacillus herberti]
MKGNNPQVGQVNSRKESPPTEQTTETTKTKQTEDPPRPQLQATQEDQEKKPARSPGKQQDQPVPLEGQAKTWTRQELLKLFQHSADVVVKSSFFGMEGEKEVVLIYAVGLCDTMMINRLVLPELASHFEQRGSFSRPLLSLSDSLTIEGFPRNPSQVELEESIYSGILLLFFVQDGLLATLNICNPPRRTPNESSTEISINGPRDCFIEDIDTNIALVRKRMRTSSLHIENFTVGKRTRTRVSLLYIEDIADPKPLETVRRRMNEIDIDGLYSVNQLESLLLQSRFKILPLVDFTGRPDFVISSLLAGRFTLIVDGNPMVIIAPASLSFIMKSPEDVHFNFSYVSFARMIRIISLFLSIFLPAIWIALMAFHQDQIPFRLMATISISRLGIPFSAQMEMLLLLLLLEIFKEAGVRLPNPIGQTLTSIGGLIIGDAAIRAGLVSPSVVVVGAITAVSGVTLVNQVLSTVVSIFRFFFFLAASFFGLYGVILGMVLLVAYMSRLQSFGVSYLTPLSPLLPKDVLASYLRVPWAYLSRRPSSTVGPNKDKDHKDGGDNS